MVLAGRRIERLKALRADIEAAGGDAHVVTMDVTDPQDIKAAVAHAETEMGTIDILVNNSGVSTTQKLVDVTPDDYDFVMDTNTRGAFFVAQEVGKRMIARAKGAAPGTFTGGRIVNVASMAGLKVLGQIGVYAMSKAAVIHMTRAMALEWGRFGINVNAICPGYVDTEINHHHWETEAGRQAGRDAAEKARRQAGRPRRGADDAVRQREPLRQRRGDPGRRRLRALTSGAGEMTPTPLRALSLLEARVVAVLVEKQATVADSYPLTLNALVAGCNQKTARDPVIAASDSDVLQAVDALKSLNLVVEVSGSRVSRYEHNMKRVLGVPAQSVALLTLLMLRGPQTAAELRTNCERLHRFADISSVEGFLDELAEREPPLVVKLARAPRHARAALGAPAERRAAGRPARRCARPGRRGRRQCHRRRRDSPR